MLPENAIEINGEISDGIPVEMDTAVKVEVASEVEMASEVKDSYWNLTESEQFASLFYYMLHFVCLVNFIMGSSVKHSAYETEWLLGTGTIGFAFLFCVVIWPKHRIGFWFNIAHGTFIASVYSILGAVNGLKIINLGLYIAFSLGATTCWISSLIL